MVENKKKYIIGVDGGNTKTDYLLFDTEGNFIDGLRSGTCSHEGLKDSFDGSYRVMKEQLEILFTRNNITVKDIAGAGFGLAGADVPYQKKKLNEIITKIGFENFGMENDGFLGVKAASPNGCGVCSINGTGTVTVGMDELGNHVQVGGVGYLSGDEAGGAFLTRRTFQAVYDELYRVGPATSMTKELFEKFGITDKEDYLATIVDISMSGKLNRTEIIQMLFRHANNGDEVAKGVLRTAGRCMGLSTAGCIDNLNFQSTAYVVLAGSVWANAAAPDMFDGFKEAIESNIKASVEYIVLKVAPASGAIIWAMELANGVLPNDEMRAKILANVEAYQKTQAGTK